MQKCLHTITSFIGALHIDINNIKIKLKYCNIIYIKHKTQKYRNIPHYNALIPQLQTTRVMKK